MQVFNSKAISLAIMLGTMVMVYPVNFVQAQNSDMTKSQMQQNQEARQANREEAIDVRCENVEQRVELTITRYENNIERHKASYQRMVDRLQQSNQRLTELGYDTSEVAAILKEMNTLLISFSQKTQAVIGQLEVAQGYACGESEGQYKSAMQKSHELAKEARSISLDIRSKYQSELRPALTRLKAQQPTQ